MSFQHDIITIMLSIMMATIDVIIIIVLIHEMYTCCLRWMCIPINILNTKINYAFKTN